MTKEQIDRQAAMDKMEAMLKKAEDEKRDMTAAEDLDFRALGEMVDKIDEKSRPQKTIAMNHISGTNRNKRVYGGVGVSYRNLYFPDGKFSDDSGEFEKMLVEIAETGKRAMMSGTGAKGGFFVPDNQAVYVTDQTAAIAVCFPACFQIPMLKEGNSITFGAFDSSDQSSGFYGNVQAQWRAEGVAFSVQDFKCRANTFVLHKCGIFTDFTREAVEDAPDLTSLVVPMMAEGLAQTYDEKILVGSGVAEPLGVLNAPATIKVTRAVANTVTYPDIVGMFSRLHPTCIRRARWIVSSEVLPQLLQMTDPASGYIWMPSAVDSAAAAMPGRLLGIPLYVSDKASQLGIKGDVTLADFGFYGFVMKKQIIIESTNAARWNEDIVSYRSIVRVAGQPMIHSAITPRNGGDTLSAFVTLE